MRYPAFFFASLLFVRSMSAEVPALQASPREIETYSKELLLKLFPEDCELIEQTPVVVWNFYRMDAFVSKRVIYISIAFVDAMESEDEYAATLAHEFGHVKLTEGVYPLPEINSMRDEFAADAVAAAALLRSSYNPIALATVLRKMHMSLGCQAEDNGVDLARIFFLENKFSPPS